MAVLAAYYAALCDHSEILGARRARDASDHERVDLAGGEDAPIFGGYFLDRSRAAALVTGQTNDSLSLSTRVDIECAAASFRTIRGGTAVAIVADEAAFWRNEATANPDSEILAAARPMLATTNGPLIVDQLALRATR